MSIWSSDGLTVHVAKVWKEQADHRKDWQHLAEMFEQGQTLHACLCLGPCPALTFKACVQKAHYCAHWLISKLLLLHFVAQTYHYLVLL